MDTKKVLLGSTAIVGAGMLLTANPAHAQLEVTLSGFGMDAAASMADQFFAAFSNHLSAATTAAPSGPTKLGRWSLLLSFIKRLFKGSKA